jgi:hypothetical protein
MFRGLIFGISASLWHILQRRKRLDYIASNGGITDERSPNNSKASGRDAIASSEWGKPLKLQSR